MSSCGTNPLHDQVVNQREAIEDMAKEDKILGDEVPSWTKRSGIEGGILYVVGRAEFSADKSPFYVEKAAAMDGETKLLSDAPVDMRILTQNALRGAGIESSEFTQIQTKLQEVIGVVGIRHSQEKTTCRKVLRYGTMSTYLNRVCWIQVFIPVRQLFKAYERTMALKFGTYKAERFRQLLDEELKKINDNPLLKEKKHDQGNNNSISDDRKLPSSRLPANRKEEISPQSKIQSTDNEGRYIPNSRAKAESRLAKHRIHATDQTKGSSNSNEQEILPQGKIRKEPQS